MIKFLLTIFLFSFILFSCDNDSAQNTNYEILLLKQQVASLQTKLDSLIQVLNEKKPPALQKSKKKLKASIPAAQSFSVKTTDQTQYNSEKRSEIKTPAYTPKKKIQTYGIRTGAICCDGSRSYATGRGACSHHGGVCQWLYQ